MWCSGILLLLLQPTKEFNVNGAVHMLTPQSQAIVDILLSYGPVKVIHLSFPPEELSEETHVTDVCCAPGVFPVDSASPNTVTVHVDKNFREIFKFFTTQCLGGVRAAEVEGPPGCGKSLAAWYALSFLSAVKDMVVAYYPLKSAGSESESCFAILVGQLVLRVTAPSKTVLEVFGKFLTDVLLVKCPVDIKLDCLFLDGFFHEQFTGGGMSMKSLAQRLQTLGQSANMKRSIQFLGATTSMKGGCFQGDAVQKHHSEPWDLDEYMTLVRAIYTAGKTLSLERMSCLGFTEANASLADIEAAIQGKYGIAGHSCRFMLDYTSEEVQKALNEACDAAQSCLGNNTQSAARIKKTLVVKRKDVIVPVSDLAHILILKHNLATGLLPLLLVHMAEAVKADNMSELDWLFEREVVCGLNNGCNKEPGDLELTYTPRWISDGMAMLNIDSQFDLRSVNGDVTFCASGVLAKFENWEDLVEIVKLFPWDEEEFLWVVPKYSRHPFLDFARAIPGKILLRWILSTRQRLPRAPATPWLCSCCPTVSPSPLLLCYRRCLTTPCCPPWSVPKCSRLKGKRTCRSRTGSCAVTQLRPVTSGAGTLRSTLQSTQLTSSSSRLWRATNRMTLCCRWRTLKPQRKRFAKRGSAGPKSPTVVLCFYTSRCVARLFPQRKSESNS